MSIQTILAIGSGGFIGAILRAYLSGVINRNFPHDIALGTLGVNIIGSFLIGVLFAVFYEIEISSHIKSFLITGMLGALTTFSTFAIESLWLFKTNYILALINIALNVVLTISFAGIGFKFFENLLK